MGLIAPGIFRWQQVKVSSKSGFFSLLPWYTLCCLWGKKHKEKADKSDH